MTGSGECHGAEVEIVELRPLADALADHVLTGFTNPELQAALARVSERTG